ncbi:MAG: flagellar hook basal-body protein, partial [Acidobacteriota bacterium]
MGSFQAALSGLKATTIAIDAVGNNLANINTTGFKRSTVSFSDVMNSVGPSPGGQIGGGVTTPTSNLEFTQGSVTTTGGVLDAAVQGSGFFVVKPNTTAGSVNNAFEYTRDGQFHVDSKGQLVTIGDNKVQGWLANPLTGLVDTTAPVQDLTV